jgi:hypothetical protein
VKRLAFCPAEPGLLTPPGARNIAYRFASASNRRACPPMHAHDPRIDRIAMRMRRPRRTLGKTALCAIACLAVASSTAFAATPEEVAASASATQAEYELGGVSTTELRQALGAGASAAWIRASGERRSYGALIRGLGVTTTTGVRSARAEDSRSSSTVTVVDTVTEVSVTDMRGDKQTSIRY